MGNLYAPLKISRGADGTCGADCMFLDSKFIEMNTGCILFNQPLLAVFIDGHAEAWRTCEACDKVSLKVWDKNPSSA